MLPPEEWFHQRQPLATQFFTKIRKDIFMSADTSSHADSPFSPDKSYTMPPSTSLEKNIEFLKHIFPIGTSYDILTHKFLFQGVPAYWIGINGFCSNADLQDIIKNLQDPGFNETPEIKDIQSFLNSKIDYVQSSLSSSWQTITKSVLSGSSALFFDGFAEAILIDTRSYPTRSIEEPDTERITRGAKDGFIENILSNSTLIRRRIRNPSLTFEIKTVGDISQTDVAIAYIGDLVDKALLTEAYDRLDSLSHPYKTTKASAQRTDAARSPYPSKKASASHSVQISSLTMGSKSLEELFVPKRFFHPLPSLFSTERPDVACSYLLEGYVLLLVDNSPSALVLPGTIFQFTQSPEDYYKSPSVGTLNRLMRFFCILLSLFTMPVFLLLASVPSILPGRLASINADGLNPVRLFFLVLFTEFGFHLFRYASAHSSSRFSTPMSVVGGLILSEVAMELKWSSLEIIFYASITLLANLAIASIEFSDALRLYRIFMLLCTGIGTSIGYEQAPAAAGHIFLCGGTGFLISLVLVLLSAATTPSFAGKSYFWPLIPFQWDALKTLLVRKPTAKAQPGKIWKRQ